MSEEKNEATPPGRIARAMETVAGLGCLIVIVMLLATLIILLWDVMRWLA